MCAKSAGSCVAAVLTGSVQRSKDRLRITAQLIDSQSGTHYWSEEFKGQDDDIFAIQDDIRQTHCRETTCRATCSESGIEDWRDWYR